MAQELGIQSGHPSARSQVAHEGLVMDRAILGSGDNFGMAVLVFPHSWHDLLFHDS